LAARSRKQRGLTLLEVVIALMLFAMISVFLLSGHAQATDATLRAQVEREMAELLSLRINLIALQHEDYEDGDSGGFPYSGASDRLVDEQDVFGDLYLGYTWEVSMERTIGTGATGPVSVDDGEQRNLLFAEEGAVAEGDHNEFHELCPQCRRVELTGDVLVPEDEEHAVWGHSYLLDAGLTALPVNLASRSEARPLVAVAVRANARGPRASAVR